MTMSDFEASARKTAAELGCADADGMTAFLVGAQWCLDQTIALEAAITPDEPTDVEIRAAAEAMMLAEDDASWMEATPHQRYEWSERARLALQACIDLHNDKEETE